MKNVVEKLMFKKNDHLAKKVSSNCFGYYLHEKSFLDFSTISLHLIG